MIGEYGPVSVAAEQGPFRDRECRVGRRPAIGDSEAIAIVKVTDAERDLEEVRGGIAQLRNEGEIVDRTNAYQRTEFLNERRRSAFA